MTIYFSSKSGGPCWNRKIGYHNPATGRPNGPRLSPTTMRIIQMNAGRAGGKAKP